MNSNRDSRDDAPVEKAGGAGNSSQGYRMQWGVGLMIGIALVATVVLAIWPSATTRVKEGLGRADFAGASLTPAIAGDQIDIPIDLVTGEKGKGLALAVKSSTISSKGIWIYTLTGSLRHADQGLRKLRMKIDLLDNNNKVLISDRFTPLDGYGAVIGPDDSVAIREQEQGSPSVRRARLTVDEVELVQLAGDRGRPKNSRDR